MIILLKKKQQRSNHSAHAMETGNRFKNGASSKKGLLLTLCILAISSACFAQDIIVTKDSRKIEAKTAPSDSLDLSTPSASVSTSIPAKRPTVRPFPKSEANATSTPQGEDASTSTENTPKTTRWGIKGGLNIATMATLSSDFTAK